jgi:hypothetical protein
MQEQVADERLRTGVIKKLAYALRDDDRPDLPSWQGQPNVMFSERDRIPRALGWSEPTMTGTAYHEKLAAFLGDLACGDASPALAQGIARHAVDEANRLLSPDLAQRLTPDDPQACPVAAALPERLRAQLEQTADRHERPPSDQAEPKPAPPDAPSQKPQPSVPNP